MRTARQYKPCLNCGTPFAPKQPRRFDVQLFCCHPCSTEYRTKLVQVRTEKRCSLCKRVLPLKNFAPYRTTSCRDCTRVYVRARNLTHPRHGPRPRGKDDPAREKARRKLRYEVLRGRVKRMPCEVCGDPNSHAHHEDYSKPLEVQWLCHSHHQHTHRKPVDTPLTVADVLARGLALPTPCEPAEEASDE